MSDLYIALMVIAAFAHAAWRFVQYQREQERPR